MPVKLGDLASRVGGQLIGDPELLIEGARPLSDARQGEITLLDPPCSGGRRPQIRASAVVAPQGFEPDGVAAILVDDTHAAFARIIGVFRPPRVAARRGVSPLAVVSPSARLADDVEIHPLATIGDGVEIGCGATIHSGVHIMAGSKVGPGTTLFPNVVLHENTVVGARCMIHSGTSLGTSIVADGRGDGPWGDKPPPGNVELADDVRHRRRDHYRPRSQRSHRHWPVHQDRQPRNDRPQRADRSAQSALFPGADDEPVPLGPLPGGGRAGGREQRRPDPGRGRAGRQSQRPRRRCVTGPECSAFPPLSSGTSGSGSCCWRECPRCAINWNRSRQPSPGRGSWKSGVRS